MVVVIVSLLASGTAVADVTSITLKGRVLGIGLPARLSSHEVRDKGAMLSVSVLQTRLADYLPPVMCGSSLDVVMTTMVR